MIWLSESKSGKKVAVNPKNIVAVFEVTEEGDLLGKTGISLTNGTLVVDDEILDVVGRLQAAQ